MIFDSFLHDVSVKHKLSPEGVTQVYMGSLYNPNKHAMQIWLLYPSSKKPIVTDTQKAFGHIMTLQIGEEGPMMTTGLGVNIAKLNKAQIQFLVKEN